MRIDTATDIWMLSPKVLWGLTEGVLHELHNRITDERDDWGKGIDLKKFESACAVVNKSCQALNRSMG